MEALEQTDYGKDVKARLCRCPRLDNPKCMNFKAREGKGTHPFCEYRISYRKLGGDQRALVLCNWRQAKEESKGEGQ